MRSPFSFIVKPLKGRRYDNIKSIGDINFITSTSQEDHTASNRFAEVISTPLWYDGEIKPGDILLVHHNVFKYYYDMKGRQQSSHNHFKDDMFFVGEDQFFMFFNGNEWKCYSKYCFIEPVKIKDYYLAKPGTEEPLIGKIRYINQELIDLGLAIGDEIAFEPYSEYEFKINDEKLYRMFTKNIKIKL